MVATRAAKAAAATATATAKATPTKTTPKNQQKAMTTGPRRAKPSGPKRTAGSQSERKAPQQLRAMKNPKDKTVEEEEKLDEEQDDEVNETNAPSKLESGGDEDENSSSSGSEEEEKLLHAKLLRYDDEQEEEEDEREDLAKHDDEQEEDEDEREDVAKHDEEQGEASGVSASEEEGDVRPPPNVVKAAIVTSKEPKTSQIRATPTAVQANTVRSSDAVHRKPNAPAAKPKQPKALIGSEQKVMATAAPKLMSYAKGGDSSGDYEEGPEPTGQSQRNKQARASLSKGNIKNVDQGGHDENDPEYEPSEISKQESKMHNVPAEDASDDDDDEVSEREVKDEGDGQSEDGEGDEKKSTTSKGTKLTGIDRREAVLIKRLRNEVRRQAKTSKKYEMRKIIRDIKTVKEKQKPDEKKLEKLEQKLAALKAIDVNEFAAKAMADVLKGAAKAETDDDDEVEGPKAADTVEARLESKLLEFKGLQAALKEFIDRPKRERLHHERQKKRAADLAKKEAKKLERQDYTLVCGIANCTARFATEEARAGHRVKRHHTTGDLKADMVMGLRENRPGQRDRKAFALLKAGASAEEVEKIRNPKKARKPEDGEGRKRERQAAADERPAAARIDTELRAEKKPAAKNGDRPVARPEKKRPIREEASSMNKRELEEKRPRTQPDTSSSAPKEKADAGNIPAPGKSQKLHPSWEAKRKATQLVEFQGKAVEFSDDE